jgi:hypothetical protein
MHRKSLTESLDRAAHEVGPWTVFLERGATAGTGGKPEPPPFPVAGAGLSKRAFHPARTARTYREDEDADDYLLQDEDEDESHLRVRGDEDGESEAAAEMLELFETAATALDAVVKAMRRRATSEIGN